MDVDACLSRLRVTVKDPQKVAEVEDWKKEGARGLVKKNKGIQAIDGWRDAAPKKGWRHNSCAQPLTESMKKSSLITSGSLQKYDHCAVSEKAPHFFDQASSRGSTPLSTSFSLWLSGMSAHMQKQLPSTRSLSIFSLRK